MKKTFAARRVARKVGQDDEEESETAPGEGSEVIGSVVKRPNAKQRKQSSLRASFGPSVVDEDSLSEDSAVTPNRSTLSRVAAERNAIKRTSLLATQLPVRYIEDQEDRPSYNAAHLQELRDSTPSTPRERDGQSIHIAGTVEDASTVRDLDIASKFGPLAQYDQSSVIPSATEIAEKKARRARLAKEQQAEEFISLDPDDPDLDDDDNVMRDDFGRLVLKPKDKYGQSESRLVRDDEDVMENFEEFTEDGRISLGRRAEAEAAQKRKQEMAAQIAEAEGGSDSDTDASERERNNLFEAAQTKHGAFAQPSGVSEPSTELRPRTPPIITPIPTLDGALNRLRSQLVEMQTSRMQKVQEMEALRKEKIRLAEEEVRIQAALTETAEKFQALRREKGLSEARPNIGTPAGLELGVKSSADGVARPIDNRTDGTLDTTLNKDSELDEEERIGLGAGTSRRGLGATSD